MKLTKTIFALLFIFVASSTMHSEVISEIQHSDGTRLAIPIIIQDPVTAIENIPSTNKRSWVSSIQLQENQQQLNTLAQLSIEFENNVTDYFEITKIQLEENSGEVWESTEILHHNQFSSFYLNASHWTLSNFSSRDNNFFEINNVRTIYITTLSNSQREDAFQNNPVKSLRGYTTEHTPSATQEAEDQTLNTSALGVTITNITLDEKTIQNGDYVGSTPTIEFLLNSDTFPISSWNISIQSDSNEYISSAVLSESTQNIRISHKVNTPLSSGSYSLTVSATNSNNETSSANIITFDVNTKFALNNVLNSPNPFNPNLELNYIEYQLTQDADVVIMLYSIDGEKQKEWRFDASTAPGGKAGYNSIPWNGVNRFNETVANGVYIAYIIAKSDGKTQKDKTKIMVLK